MCLPVPFSTEWDIEQYHEPEPVQHWELRKEFMQIHKDKYPEVFVVALADAYVNVIFKGYSYEEPLMWRLEELSKDISIKDYRENTKKKKKKRLKRRKRKYLLANIYEIGVPKKVPPRKRHIKRKVAATKTTKIKIKRKRVKKRRRKDITKQSNLRKQIKQLRALGLSHPIRRRRKRKVTKTDPEKAHKKVGKKKRKIRIKRNA